MIIGEYSLRWSQGEYSLIMLHSLVRLSGLLVSGIVLVVNGLMKSFKVYNFNTNYYYFYFK